MKFTSDKYHHAFDTVKMEIYNEGLLRNFDFKCSINGSSKTFFHKQIEDFLAIQHGSNTDRIEGDDGFDYFGDDDKKKKDGDAGA